MIMMKQTIMLKIGIIMYKKLINLYNREIEDNLLYSNKNKHKLHKDKEDQMHNLNNYSYRNKNIKQENNKDNYKYQNKNKDYLENSKKSN